MGYIANFIVYTLAMVGVIVFALLVFKKSTAFNGTKSSKYLKVVDTMSLAPRKMLYIVSAGNEKFLIAGDSDKTTLISKLESENNKQILNFQQSEEHLQENTKSFQDTMSSLKKADYADRRNLTIKSPFSDNCNNTKSVIRNLADIMRG